VGARWIVLASVLLAGAGCNDPQRESNLPRTSPGTTRNPPGDAETVYSAASQPGRGARPIDPNAPSDPNARPRSQNYAVDAMVGQINGKPVYASSVFEGAGTAQLRQLGRNNPPEKFRQQAAFLLGEKLREIVTNSLILAEAEASLTEQQQMGLYQALRKFRESVISESGGSKYLAQRRIRRLHSMSLDQYVEEHRQKILTQRYLREKLYPRVHVTRREVERYYREHHDKFNPEGTVAVAVIYTDDPDRAGKVQAALNSGTSFQAAGRRAGVKYRPRLEYETDLDQFDEFPDEVDKHVRKLEVGEHTDGIATDKFHYFVKLVDVTRVGGRTLSDVYLQIEQRLRSREFDRLNRKYLQELLERGNYTPIERMMQALLKVAMNRYAATG
jgi:peptidyl-prolyl cis-trans isomerase SurA